MNATAVDPSAPLRVAIVDDEGLARLRLRSLLEVCEPPPAVVVVFEAANAADAAASLAAHDCELLLLDVQMPGADGTRLAAELRQRAEAGASVPSVVFVTAHAEHALKAFDLEAVDYLTKPVRRERLQAALRRVVRWRAALAAPPTVASATPDIDDGPGIVVSERGRIVRVPLGEVLYLKAELKYVTVRTAKHTHVIDEALQELEARLGERFLRVHRNALVSRRAVRALERRAMPAGEGDDEHGEGWAVRIAPVDEWLAVSRRQVAAVREALVAAGR